MRWGFVFIEITYLGDSGGEEGTSFIHPTILTGLCVWFCHIGERAIQMKEMPLWLNKATTPVWPGVRVQWDRDPQEVILAQNPTVNVRGSIIIKDVDPAAMTRDGCSEVLQNSLRSQHDIADQKESYLKDLESPHVSNSIQEILKSHWGEMTVSNGK